MEVTLTPERAAHRQTGYEPSPILDPPVALPLPDYTADIEQAKRDIGIRAVPAYRCSHRRRG